MTKAKMPKETEKPVTTAELDQWLAQPDGLNFSISELRRQ
jgi:hypothetical protein